MNVFGEWCPLCRIMLQAVIAAIVRERKTTGQRSPNSASTRGSRDGNA
jgi:hypothetical protein